MKLTDRKTSVNAKHAAFALATGWQNYMNSTDKSNACLSHMRKTAIDVICQEKYADDSVYDSLEKSYINNFISTEPDFEEIKKTLDALAAINTDRAISMLLLFLQGLHQKKCNGTWGNKENEILPWVINSLGVAQAKSRNVWNLLVVIYRTDKYSNKERLHAKKALLKIKEAFAAAAAAANETK